MTDYFSYNGEDVIPTYMPGISSYGQEGSEGNTGDKGSSVYYATYDLSDEDDLAACNEKIKNNLVLSDTEDLPLYNGEYMIGDIIIDSLGNLYVIEEVDGVLQVPAGEETENASTAEMFKDFKVRTVTSFLRNSDYPPYIKEDSYKKLAELQRFDKFGFDEMRQKIYGNWLAFNITPLVKSTSYSYTFSLVLPSKEVLSVTSDDPYAKMFVDNRYFISCGGGETIIPVEDPYDTGKEMFGSDIRTKVENENVNDFIYNSYPKYGNTVFEVETDEEQLKYATMLTSYYIHTQCTAYVEIKNKITGKIYRYDLNENGYDTDSSTSVAFRYDSFITPYIEEVSWEIEKDSSYEGTFNALDVSIDGSIMKIQRSLKNFVASGSEQVSVIDELGSIEYEYVQHLYFTDVKGTDGYEPLPDDVDIDNQTPLHRWINNAKIDQYPHVIKLEFAQVDSLCLNIDFTKYQWKEGIDFPATVVYVGYPNVHLWQEGDEDGNVLLPNSINEGKTDDEGNPVFDGSRGYYYMYKIFPPGYVDDDNTANAGRSSIIYDLSSFNLQEKNWIEVGAMMISDFSNKSHRPSVTPSNPEYAHYEGDIRLVPFGELHGEGGQYDPDTLYKTFEIRDRSNPSWRPTSSDEPVEPYFDAEDCDVTLFLNAVEKHSYDAGAGSSDDVELSETTEKINYKLSGISYDPEIEIVKITDDENQ